MRASALVSSIAVFVVGATAAWYDGIRSVHVMSPSDSQVQETIDDIFREMGVDPPGVRGIPFKGQFGTNRKALILRRGDYGDVTIPVNFYTSVIGVGGVPDAVKVGAILANDTYPDTEKGGLENFWRSVEGLTTMHQTVTWAVSQAAPLRRVNITGDLFLSQRDGEQVHYTSGGFMSEVAVGGTLHWGTQQQFFFRNCDFASVDYTGAGRSFVFVGVKGAPTQDAGKTTPYISAVDTVPGVAEKPYLVEENDVWSILVPSVRTAVAPGTQWEQTLLDEMIPMTDVFVAKEGDNESTITIGMQGKRALLLTPAIYYFDKPLFIKDPNFVVLGIGFPTLVTTSGFSALVVEAPGVRVAQVLIEAGHEKTRDATAPMFQWNGPDGVASDIFTRVGAFAYETDKHQACLQTHASIHVDVPGDRVIVDNTWFWHADHDDCTPVSASPASDKCYSGNGLVVSGDNVTVYGLAVEHTSVDLVDWKGEGGLIFFFQSELPYHDPSFADQGYCGYKVAYGIQRHTAYGVGIYQVFPTYTLEADMRVPATAQLTNTFSWAITTKSNKTLGKLLCASPGMNDCHQGTCDNNSCHIKRFPIPQQSTGPMVAPALIKQLLV